MAKEKSSVASYLSGLKATVNGCRYKCHIKNQQYKIKNSLVDDEHYRCDGGFTAAAGGFGPEGFSKESSRLPDAAHSFINE
jgi:hypothetical protein